ERVLQVGFQLPLCLVRFESCRVEELALRPAQHTRAVRGGLCVTQNLVGPRITCGAYSDADAGRQKNLTVLQGKRGPHLFGDVIRHHPGVINLFQTLEQNGESIAIESRHHIVAKRGVSTVKAGLQPTSNRRKEGGGVAQPWWLDDANGSDVEEQDREEEPL